MHESGASVLVQQELFHIVRLGRCISYAGPPSSESHGHSYGHHSDEPKEKSWIRNYKLKDKPLLGYGNAKNIKHLQLSNKQIEFMDDLYIHIEDIIS